MVEPEIPSNTGNIARTCSVTGASLHLIKPLGFSVDDKQLKRAGLDYWSELDVQIYENFDEIRNKYFNKQFYYCTTKGKNLYSDVKYPEEVFFVFGKETRGLPEDLLNENKPHCIRIPMRQDMRSLNLANSASIIMYEALRQHGFEGLETESLYLDN